MALQRVPSPTGRKQHRGADGSGRLGYEERACARASGSGVRHALSNGRVVKIEVELEHTNAGADQELRRGEAYAPDVGRGTCGRDAPYWELPERPSVRYFTPSSAGFPTTQRVKADEDIGASVGYDLAHLSRLKVESKLCTL